MNIEEIQSTAKKQRVATHTHIKGLGLEVLLLLLLTLSGIHLSLILVDCSSMLVLLEVRLGFRDLKLICFVFYAQRLCG